MVVGLTVAPRVGAWIEMKKWPEIMDCAICRAPRGRVD